MTAPSNPPPSKDPLDVFVDAVLQSYGQLALVIEHMLRSASPKSESLPVVLRRLLREVLEPLAARHGDTDVAIAAEVLARATDAIGEDLYLVPLDRLSGES